MIINKATKKVISKEEIICKNIFSWSRGLMFRKKHNLLMIFPNERKIYLHNLFVFYPLDLLVLDKNLKIIEIKKNFRPFAFWNSTKKGKYVLELAYPLEYKIDDQLKLKDL